VAVMKSLSVRPRPQWPAKLSQWVSTAHANNAQLENCWKLTAPDPRSTRSSPLSARRSQH